MMKANFSELVLWMRKTCWTFCNNIKHVLLAALALVAYRLTILSTAYLPHGPLISGTLAVVTVPPLFTGFSFFCLQLVREKNATVADFLSGFKNFLRVWAVNMIVMLLVLGGSLLLVVPGIVWGIKYGLAPIIVLDKKCSCSDAIRLSGKITTGYKILLGGLMILSTLLFALYLWLNSIIGSECSTYRMLPKMTQVLVHCVHSLVITPWLSIVWVTAYDRLTKKHNSL